MENNKPGFDDGTDYSETPLKILTVKKFIGANNYALWIDSGTENIENIYLRRIRQKALYDCLCESIKQLGSEN